VRKLKRVELAITDVEEGLGDLANLRTGGGSWEGHSLSRERPRVQECLSAIGSLIGVKREVDAHIAGGSDSLVVALKRTDDLGLRAHVEERRKFERSVTRLVEACDAIGDGRSARILALRFLLGEKRAWWTVAGAN
jgi:hypothetical protein